MLLQLVQCRRFVDARRAPRSPEIQKDNFPAEVGDMRGLAVESEREVLGGAATEACFALAIIGPREKVEQSCDEGEDEACFDFPF